MNKIKLNEKIRSKKAITLISLVITIIIIVILAAVAINVVIGKDGLINKAITSIELTKIAAAKEKIQIAVVASYDANVINNDILKENVNNIKGLKNQIETIVFDLNINVDGYDFIVKSNGEIIRGVGDITENGEQQGGTGLQEPEEPKGPDYENPQPPQGDEKIIENGKTYDFNCTERVEEFIAEQSGWYRFECWGAGGGNSIGNGIVKAYGGKGGYTYGILYMYKGDKIYVCVGAKGADAEKGKDTIESYNGGGLGTWDGEDDEAAGAGGGATDIRLVSGEWNDFDSLKSRIMVAAGGGGAGWTTAGGNAGGLKGYTNRTYASPGTQTTGYKFGIGQNGYGTGNSDGVGGSGSGYYGGTTSDKADGKEAGTGGSSFVSGYIGCNAISGESTTENIIHTNQEKHYSNRTFRYIQIEDGASDMPSYTSTSRMTGNSGEGHARITFISTNNIHSAGGLRYGYTGDYQEIKITETGNYKIECYGAAGGYSINGGSKYSNGGNGAYTSGIINLNKGEIIYLYVGQKGSDGIVGSDTSQSFNGGGLGTWDRSDDESAGAGGGATDIRLVSGAWNDFNSLKSRIMVAAGGGGASWNSKGGNRRRIDRISNKIWSIWRNTNNRI